MPDDCTIPGLVDLFHYQGQPQNADAVRYTAASGARIFAGGAQQLSWSLDPFNTSRYGRTLPADAPLQQFMRNVLDDLGRPAPPASLTAQVGSRTVTLRIGQRADRRVVAFEVVRHPGAQSFQLSDSGVVRLCRTSAARCVSRRPRPGTYRYAVVADDPWGQSFAKLSQRVVVRKARR